VRGAGLASGAEYGVGPGIGIGRAGANDISIQDSFASGRHARLYDREGMVYIEDMNSTNGTYVNGRRLGAQQVLRPSDRIRIGDTEFRFEQ
jgi:pSer/pThr/pTyr-binding forkhead associated (FHA) protein